MSEVIGSVAPSRTWTFFESDWHEGNVGIMGPRTHGAWLGSVVFDGGRAFEGVTPDLDLHCARINQSAIHLRLKPIVSAETWLALVEDGRKRFDTDAALYVRPMYWAEAGAAGGGVRYDPESTKWCLCLYEAPMPEPTGATITLSPYRRPTSDSAPVEAKASCLYPNNSRALIEAFRRGFTNCLLRDALGNIAELGNANVFLAKNGAVFTPVPNGTFLDGITRRRVIGLLRGAGVTVHETALTYDAFLNADEIFSSGNFLKVAPVVRIDNRDLQPGPFYQQARKLYWEFAHSRTT